MVHNRRIGDSSILARPRFKIKQPLMESASGTVPLVRNNAKQTRWQLENGVGTSCSSATTSEAIGNAAGAADVVIKSNGKGGGMTIPSVTSTQQPTTHQKVRRILEEHAILQEAGKSNDNRRSKGPRALSLVTSASSVANRPKTFLANYKIVASRGGELSRGCFTVRETVTKLGKNGENTGRRGSRTERNGTDPLNDSLREESRSGTRQRTSSNWEKRADRSRDSGDTSNWRESRNCEQCAIPKSSSVPANLKTVAASTANNHGKYGVKNPANGILRKSTAFLASLTGGGAKSIGDRDNRGNIHDGVEPRREKTRFGLLGRRSPLAASRGGETKDTRVFGRSPSCQNLSCGIGRRKNEIARSAAVKKSVSFSSDTSFEEKRAPFRKTAVHEAKLYRKGVLRDFNASEAVTRKVQGTRDSPPGDPKALLRASREADDLDLRELVARIRRSGLGEMDVNATDSSGRTAISYMAGNGSPAMLEAALTFPGSDPNLPDNEGNTPLHFAAQAGQPECLNILLQRCPGIEVDARNVLGFTPLMKAALQGRTKCAKILLFAGANPTMRDHGKGLRAEQWARYCGRHVCADIIERFARHKMIEKNISCRWGSEPELATKVLQGKVLPVPATPLPPPSTGFRSKIKRVFRTSSGPDRSFSLVTQLTSAALCASTPALPKPGDSPTNVRSLVRPLSVPQLRVELVGSQAETTETKALAERYVTSFTEKIETTIEKPPRSKKKNK